jgi:hypothetical protein
MGDVSPHDARRIPYGVIRGRYNKAMERKSEMAALYEEDFYAWTQRAGELLRSGCFGQIDIEHVAEEIEDMGKEQKHALKSQMRRLIVHLLKWEFQPQKRSDSWLESIDDARLEIADDLDQNPSLKPMMPDLPSQVYAQAVKRAALESHLNPRSFPAACPYTFQQLMDEEFLPGPSEPDPRKEAM